MKPSAARHRKTGGQISKQTFFVKMNFSLICRKDKWSKLRHANLQKKLKNDFWKLCFWRLWSLGISADFLVASWTENVFMSSIFPSHSSLTLYVTCNAVDKVCAKHAPPKQKCPLWNALYGSSWNFLALRKMKYYKYQRQ